MFKAIAIWIAGLVTIVPYGTYYLLFHASRDQYAALITLVLFWIFGYWGVAGPLLGVIRVRRLMRTLEAAQSRGELEAALRSEKARQTAIDFIATENRIPRFVARRLFDLAVRRLSARVAAESAVATQARGNGGR